MGTVSDSPTSSTFLESLSTYPADPAVWQNFVERYGPMIYEWCRKWGAQQADADDISQLVLIKLLARMRTFTYDRKHHFRGWLSTVVRNACIDLAAENRRHSDLLSRSSAVELLAIVEAQDELVEWIDHDHRREILKCAMDRVRNRVAASTWHAFQLTAIEENTGAEVARLLGISIGAVFQGRNRIQRMIKQEIRAITGTDSL